MIAAALPITALCLAPGDLTEHFVEEVAGTLPERPSLIALRLGENGVRVFAALRVLVGRGRAVLDVGGVYHRVGR